MRSLIKNDPGIQYIDEQTLLRTRRRRRAFRLAIAVVFISLAGYSMFQLAVSSHESTTGPAVSLSEPKSLVTWTRWTISTFLVQVRDTLNGTFPSGTAIVLKFVICFGLGALFLRMPQRY
jgi:hypothetical protein